MTISKGIVHYFLVVEHYDTYAYNGRIAYVYMQIFRWFHALQLATKAELPSHEIAEHNEAQHSQLIVDAL